MREHRDGPEIHDAKADPAWTGGRLARVGHTGRRSDSLRRGGGRQHVDKEERETRETPTVRGRVSQPELREEQAGPSGAADRLVLLMKPGNSGGGKEPDFWRVTGRDQESGDWLCLSTPFN